MEFEKIRYRPNNASGKVYVKTYSIIATKRKEKIMWDLVSQQTARSKKSKVLKRVFFGTECEGVTAIINTRLSNRMKQFLIIAEHLPAKYLHFWKGFEKALFKNKRKDLQNLIEDANTWIMANTLTERK